MVSFQPVSKKQQQQRQQQTPSRNRWNSHIENKFSFCLQKNKCKAPFCVNGTLQQLYVCKAFYILNFLNFHFKN